MLIQFAIKNFRSFRDRAELNMRSSESYSLEDRIVRKLSQHLGVLRCASIYGANAAGKSNLVHALGFCRTLVLNGPQSKNSTIRVQPFRLSGEYVDQPSEFEIYFYHSNTVFGLSLSVNTERVIRETLTTINLETLEETEVYNRHNGEYSFSAELKASQEDPKYLDFLAAGTKDNQLFVQEATERDLTATKPISDWFSNLIIVSPRARFSPLEQLIDSDKSFRSHLQDALQWADTGIATISSSRDPMDEDMQAEVEELLSDPRAVRLLRRTSRSQHRMCPIQNENGTWELLKVGAEHRSEDGKTVEFSFEEESDGTNRFLDLAPILYFSSHEMQRVFVVDELDRSLHTLLAQELIQRFVEIETSDCQLIFTTHDTNLLDCSVMRHDCIWFAQKKMMRIPATPGESATPAEAEAVAPAESVAPTESAAPARPVAATAAPETTTPEITEPTEANEEYKEYEAGTVLYSLAEYDKEMLDELSGDLERGYLHGRFGAIPFTGDLVRLGWLKEDADAS